MATLRDPLRFRLTARPARLHEDATLAAYAARVAELEAAHVAPSPPAAPPPLTRLHLAAAATAGFVAGGGTVAAVMALLGG